MGNGDIAPPFLYLGSRRRSVVSFMSSEPESWEKSSQCPLICRLGGPQSPSGHVGEHKNSFPFWEFNHDSSLIQPIAQELYTYMLTQCSDRNSHNELEEWTKTASLLYMTHEDRTHAMCIIISHCYFYV
jgi:hypothetical protein